MLFWTALGELDAAMYAECDSDDDAVYEPNSLGRMWYTLAYSSEMEQLSVTVIKAKNLPCSNLDAPQDCAIKWVQYKAFQIYVLSLYLQYNSTAFCMR